MKAVITPSKLNGEVLIPFSKSYSHRYLIASFLANSNYENNYLKCNDIDETLNIIKTLKINKANEEISLNFGKSASTLRFFIPILLLSNKTFYIKQTEELYNRPLDVYINLFKDSVLFKYQSNKTLVLQGPLKNNVYEVEGNISSQFISGLLFALPLLKNDSKIILKSNLVSKNYVDLTIDVLKKFKINIKKTAYGFFIKGNQKYMPFNYEIERDFSQAANWFVAGTINNDLKLKGLNNESLQGDSEIIKIINKANGKIIYKDGLYEVNKVKTHNFEVDLNNIPDLGPILFVLAAQSNGISKFININRLKIKESDRLNNMIQVLNKFGVKTKLNNNVLFIEGTKNISGKIELTTYNDHRILMAIFILALNANGEVIIDNISSINKSYPNFLTDYINLGGNINVIK